MLSSVTPPSSGPIPGRVALAAAAAAYGVLMVWQAFTLPPDVPGHVGPTGEVTRWDTLTTHLITMVLTGLLVVLMFAGLPAVLGRLPASAINLPHKEYWLRPANLPAAKRLLADDLGRLGAGLLAFVGFTFWCVGLVAQGQEYPTLAFWVAFVVFVAAALAWGLSLQFGRRWRPPAGGN